VIFRVELFIYQRLLHHFKNNSLDEFLEITIITDQTSSSMVLLNGQTNGFGYANFKNHLYGYGKGMFIPQLRYHRFVLMFDPFPYIYVYMVVVPCHTSGFNRPP
jgi:hypothetical protein